MATDRIPEPRSAGATGKGAGPDPRRWKALALLCTAFFMVILDGSIVLVAIPSIEKELDFTAGGVQWVISAYALTFGGLMLFCGRTADLLGRRRVFVVGVALFTVASLLCGLAWTGGVLIAARALQGLSAAIMAPAALSILMTTFDEGAERNKALGVWTSVGGFGGTAGSLVAGPLTDGLGWEWIFFVNVPVGVVLLAFSPILRESRAPERVRALDPAGAVTITAALVLLVYAVVKAPEVGWTSVQTLGLLAGAAVLVVVFTVIENRSAAPLVPLRIFRSRTLVGGNVVLLTAGMAVSGMQIILTQYGQQVLHYSAMQFGLMLAVMPLMSIVGSIGGQRIVSRTGFRTVAAIGMSLIGLGCLLLTWVPVDGGFSDIFFGLFVFGPGLGSAFVAASIASLAGVSESESGLASGLNNTSFNIGLALGVAIVTTVAISYTAGPEPLAALTAGFQAGFVASVVFAALGLALALVLLRQPAPADRPTSTPATAGD